MTTQKYFERGSSYFHKRLSSIKSSEMIARDLMIVTATTRGTQNYVQSLSVLENEKGVTLKGRCSCPVGENCKHVVSVALTFMVENDFLTQKSATRKSKTTLWLEKLTQTLNPSSDRKSILIYRLSPTQQKGKIQLVFYRSRLLKKGGYGKQSRIEYHQLINNFAQRDFLSEADREIITLFGALESNVTRVAHIEGSLGALLLQKMLSTGNAYWHGNRNRALKMEKPLSTTFRWNEEGSKAKLELQLPKNVEFIATLPAYYVDIKAHVMGELRVENIEPKLLPLLLEAPEVDQEALAPLALNIVEKIPAFPLPKSIHVKEISTAPQAVLTLFSAKDKEENLHQSELVFLYDSVAIYGGEKNLTRIEKEGNTYIKIIRDLQKEALYVEQMEGYGFVAHVVDERLFFKPEENVLIQWQHFIKEGIADLEASGVEVRIEDSFMMRFETVEKVNIGVEGSSKWFDVAVDVEIAGEKINMLELISTLIKESSSVDELADQFVYEYKENHYLTLDSEQFKPIVQTIIALFKGERVAHFELPSNALHLLPKESALISYSGTKMQELSTIKSALENFEGIEEAGEAKGLQATLRTYQKEGVNWLNFLEGYGFGGILADDMGLGKTIQTLALLQLKKEQKALKKGVLIVAPTSLLSNWKNETKKFTPDLTLHIHHGLKRSKTVALFEQYDVIVTTYALLTRDSALFSSYNFDYFILDEAQNIKNHKSKAHGAAKSIDARCTIALSGTPMENHLGELWAIFDVVMPNFLEQYKTFKAYYQTPIEKEHDHSKNEILKRRIKPFVLRRTKELVATELPSKTIMTRATRFDGAQAKLYESIRISMEKKVKEVIKEKGFAKSHITILDALLKLRQVCCDPRLVPLEEAHAVQNSAKLELLLELTEELLEEGRKILIFSQFTSMLSIIEEALTTRAVSLTKLTGATRDREAVINRFKRGEADVFLISLKAGGVGLNLTEADTVIHYDPWWNPAAEDQATDRAYRIGQEKPVFVYKLIIENSVEEKILALQAEKKKRANALFDEKTERDALMNSETLLELFCS